MNAEILAVGTEILLGGVAPSPSLLSQRRSFVVPPLLRLDSPTTFHSASRPLGRPLSTC
jgi:hypothetical protein